MRRPILILPMLALLSTGCSDPLIGSWKGIEEPKDDIHVTDGDGDSDLRGDGHATLCAQHGECERCHVIFEIVAHDDDTYGLPGHADQGCGNTRFLGPRCTLTHDDMRLECVFQGGAEGNFERVGD